jgi:hypothetical protein
MDFTGLLEPQKPHSLRLLDSIYQNGVAKDLSPTGLGKMYCASWVAKQLNCPVVVICPKNIVSKWQEVLRMYGITKKVIVINFEKLVTGNTDFLKYDLTKFHRTPKWWLSEGLYINFPNDSFVIVDEEHRCRGQHSLCSDLLIALKNKQYKMLGCSATPATSVADCKAYGYSLNLHDGKNYREWCRAYGGELDRYGNPDWNSANTLPALEAMGKLHENLFYEQKICSKMRREDFGDLFPQNEYLVDTFDLGAQNTKLLNNVFDTMQRELAALDERSKTYRNHVFSILTKARREAELLKVPAMVEWVKTTFDQERSPVLFVNYLDSLNGTIARLPDKYKRQLQIIIGGQKNSERDLIVNNFQSNSHRILLVTEKAGGSSAGYHDLNGNYPRESLVSPSPSAFDVLQCFGRIWRAMGKSLCRQQFLYAAGTYEERLADRVEKRVANMDMLTDGDLSYMQFLLD